MLHLFISIDFWLQEYIEKEQAKATKVMDTAGTSFVDADKEMLDGLPKNDPIGMCRDKFLQFQMDRFLHILVLTGTF